MLDFHHRAKMGGRIAQEGWARTCASFGLSAMLMEVSRMNDKEGRYKQKSWLSSAMMGDTRVRCGAKMVNGKWLEAKKMDRT